MLAAGAAALPGWLSEEVVEGETSRFDMYVRGVVHAWSSPRLTAVMWFFTDLGSVLVTVRTHGCSCDLLAFPVALGRSHPRSLDGGLSRAGRGT